MAGDETDLNVGVQSFGDSFQHVERVAIMFGVLEAADGGSGGSNFLGQVALAESSRGAEYMNFLSDIGIEEFVLVFFATFVRRQVA